MLQSKTFLTVVCVFFIMMACGCGPSLKEQIKQKEAELEKLTAGTSGEKRLEKFKELANKGDIAQKTAVAKKLGELKNTKGVPEFLSDMLYAKSNDYYYWNVREAALNSLGRLNSMETNMLIYQYGLQNIKNTDMVRKAIAVLASNKILPVNFISELKIPQQWYNKARQYFSGTSRLIRFGDKNVRGQLELEITNVEFSENRWKTTDARQETDFYTDKKGNRKYYRTTRYYDTYHARRDVQFKAKVSVKELDGNSLVSEELTITSDITNTNSQMPTHDEVFTRSLIKLENHLITRIYPKLTRLQPLLFVDNVVFSGEPINWETSEVTLPPLLKASLEIESKGTAMAGSAINTVVTIKNNGRGPAYRLLGIIKAKSTSIDERRVPIGKINAGEGVTRRITIDIPLKADTGEVPIEIIFKEANDYPPDPVSGVIQVASLPRPYLSYAYLIIDDMERSTKSVGNGDGIFQLGEAVELRFTIKNTGKTTARNVTLALRVPKELKGKGFLLEDPSGKLGNLDPNEERMISAVLVAKKTLHTKTIPLVVHLAEARFDSKTEETINLKIGEETKAKVITMAPKTAYVIKNKADVLSAADANTGAIFRLSGQTPVTVTGQLGKWYRVDLGQDRQGWMAKDVLSFQMSKVEKTPATPDLSKSPKIIEVFRNSPPTLYIASPKEGLKIAEETIELESFMFDALGLKSVMLFLNGRSVDIASARGIGIVAKEAAAQAALDISKKRNEYTLQAVIPLEIGANRIEVKVVNTEGLTATKFVRVERVKHLITKLPRIQALVVGINQYQEPIPSLSYAEADAQSMYELLRRPQIGLKESDIIMLLGKDATRDNILKHLDALLTKAYPEDLVILYLAMHGYPDPEGGDELYFIPHDARMADFRIKAVARSDIRRFLRAGKAGKVLFIADACHASAVSVDTVRTRDIPGRFVPLLVKLGNVQGKGIGFLTAASANEVSREDNRHKHGLFTYFLIKGLKGVADKKPWGNEDSFVTLGELSEYIRRQVHDVTKGKQNPALDPNGTLPREVPLSKVGADYKD